MAKKKGKSKSCHSISARPLCWRVSSNLQSPSPICCTALNLPVATIDANEMIFYIAASLVAFLLCVLALYGICRKDVFVFPVSIDGASRQLSFLEHRYHAWLRKFYHQICGVYVVGSSRKVTDEEVKSALLVLTKRHPLLRMKVKEVEDKLFYEEMRPLKVDFRNSKLLASKQEHWQSIFTSEVQDLVNFSEGPLWRVCRLEEDIDSAGEFVNCFTFTFHHAICDGTSRVLLLEEFVHSLNLICDGKEVTLPPLKLLPPCETLIKDMLEEDSFAIRSFLTEVRVRLQAMGMFVPKVICSTEDYFNRYKPVTDLNPSANRESRIIMHTLSKESTEQVLAACKRHSCTVTGALIAAKSMAMAEVLRGDSAVSQCIVPVCAPVNLRRHCSVLRSLLDIDQYVGLYIGLFLRRFMVPKFDKSNFQDVFWALAQEITRQLKDDLKSGVYLNSLKSLYASVSLDCSFKLEQLISSQRKCNRIDLRLPVPDVNVLCDMIKELCSEKNRVSPEPDSDSGSDLEDNDLPPVPPEEFWDKAEEVYLQPEEISEEQVRLAMLEFVSQNCCYGKKPALEMEVKEIKSSSAYHYVLETFTEEREKEKKYEPFHGQHIDSKEFGKKPKLWKIDIDPPGTFIDRVHKMELPHSAKVKDCKGCDKEGEFDCDDCEKSGKVPCGECGASGHVMRPDENGVEQEVSCPHCGGIGLAMCEGCDGDGKLTCEDCDGSGEVKKYQEVIITWKNHVDDYLCKSANIPEHIAESGTGTELFRQEHDRIPPLTSFYDESVNENSQKLVKEHSNFTSKSKILKQRHHLRVIPISEVVCKWNDEKFPAVIYGLEKKVYCPDYPQQLCCGCVLL